MEEKEILELLLTIFKYSDVDISKRGEYPQLVIEYSTVLERINILLEKCEEK